MDDEGRQLVAIDWHEGMTVPVPSDYQPSYIEVGDGVVIDEVRLLYINAAILDEHPDSERLRQVAKEHPGLDVAPGPDSVRFTVMLAGEPIGIVDKRVLDAQLTPNVPAG